MKKRNNKLTPQVQSRKRPLGMRKKQHKKARSQHQFGQLHVPEGAVVVDDGLVYFDEREKPDAAD